MKGKIVLIEDNQDMRENIQEILELDDYEVFSSPDGKSGIELINEVMPDLILCDIMMPELDGYGVLQIVSRNEELSAIPFIFLTAKAEIPDFRRGMNLGADDYLTKPFEDVELLQAIDIRFKRSRNLKQEISRNGVGLKKFLRNSREFFHLKDLSENYESKSFKKKELIYEEGKQARSLFFIESGKVKTFNLNENGKEYITNLYGPGDFFGYHPLMTDGPYYDNAEALEDSQILYISRDDFLILIHSDKQLSQKFIRLITNELKEAEIKLMKLAYESVRKRVAEGLLLLDSKYNKKNEYPFSISILREDLASIVGTAKESVIRTLSDLKEEGVIKIESGKIVVVDPMLLKEIPG